ncbi:GNAT family N-acetyltransferase [Humibacillus xanthopallidus]|uniref:GNAT family N-acetyltransferase n=1 Tax=Humibacillus xanthopallidus TaxID=412689 RepID=UPI00385017DB
MTPQVKEIDVTAGDGLSESWLEVHHAANRAVWGDAAQRTSIEEVADVAARRHEVRRSFVVTDDDSDVAIAAAQTIRRTRENVGTGGLWLSVHPDHQRRRVGTALLEHCELALRDDGCDRIHEHSGAPDEQGDAATGFAIANGYRQTLLVLRQDLALPVDEAALTALDPRPDPAAYAIETSVDGLPEEWLEDRALLARRMSTDAPSGDIDLDEEDWDAERVRQLWNTPSPIWAVESVARHVPSGRLVAFTDLVVRPGQPDLAVQTDTLVLREHRGRALGLAVKLANLRSLQRERPDVTTVRTWNADTNVHMIAINERLGFRPTGWSREWAKEF